MAELPNGLDKRGFRMSIRTKLLLGFGLPLLIVAGTLVTAYLSNRRLVESRQWVEHTNQVLDHTQILLTQLLEVSVNARGFALTGDEQFLKPHRTATLKVRGEIETLRHLTADNSNQQRRLEVLRPLAEKRIDASGRLIELRRNDAIPKKEAVISIVIESKEVMDAIRIVIEEMDEEERGLLQKRIIELEADTRRTNFIIGSGGAAAIISILLVGLVLGRNIGRSLTELVWAAEVFRSGKLEYRVKITSTDETRALAEALNRMAGQLEERDKALRESEERFRSIIDNAGSVISARDKDCRLILVNREWEEKFGVTWAEAQGKTLFEMMSQENVARILRRNQELFQSGEETEGEEVFPVAGKDHVFNTKRFPLRDASGNIYAITNVGTDITERKRLEETLRSSEQRLNLALDSAQMGIWELDLVSDRAFRNLRHDQLFGFQSLQEEWGHEIFLTHVLPEDREHVKECLQEASATGNYSMECRIVWPDQSVHWISAQGKVFRDGKGVPVRMMGIVTDATGRKRAEEAIAQLNVDLQQRYAELQDSNKELEAFTYSVSHDLRAPLRHINGFAAILEEENGASLNQEGQSALARIRQGAKHMGQLVDDLLNLSQVGRRELAPQVAGLKTIVDKAVQDVQREAKGRKIEWKIGELPFLECDPGLMEQVFINLLSNAVKYTRPRDPAVIEVGQRVENGSPTVFVRDNGVGFSMKYAEKLFGIFQRLHRQEDFEGTGVGLATVHRIIRKHGGQVWAESELDQGATFYFTLGALASGRGMGANIDASLGGNDGRK